MSHNLFNTLQEFKMASGKTGKLYSLPALEKALGAKISRLPVSIRIVLESVLRNCDGKKVTEEHVRQLAGWKPNAPRTDEIPFVLSRILLQDAREHEGDFIGARRVRFPARELADVLFGDLLAVAVAQHRLENDADRHRQARNPGAQCLLEGRQGIELAGPARSQLEFLQGVEEIV